MIGVRHCIFDIFFPTGSVSHPIHYPLREGPFALVVGDFTGDGRPGLAVANNGSSTVAIFVAKNSPPP